MSRAFSGADCFGINSRLGRFDWTPEATDSPLDEKLACERGVSRTGAVAATLEEGIVATALVEREVDLATESLSDNPFDALKQPRHIFFDDSSRSSSSSFASRPPERDSDWFSFEFRVILGFDHSVSKRNAGYLLFFVNPCLVHHGGSLPEGCWSDFRDQIEHR